MKSHFTCVVSFLLLGSALTAQSIPHGGHLVGNTGPAGIVSSLVGRLYTQAISTCAIPVFRGSTLTLAQSAGGTAYDAAMQGVWVSDGKSIVLKDISTGKETGKFSATLTGGKGNAVTGLAYCNQRRQLIQLETFPTAAGSSLALRFYDATQFPPKLLTMTCSFVIPKGNTPGTAQGLAYDEVRDLIYFTTSVPGIVTSSSVHHIAFSVVCLGPKPGNFGLPLFSTCGGTKFNPVSGLAYDSCAQILYATDEYVTLLMDVKNLSKPVNLNASKPCCKFGVSRYNWAGLAYVPQSSETAVGTSCVSSGCGSCSNMKFDIVGDLALGNQKLTLEVTDAPAGGNASLYVSIGKCASPGLQLPGLCGRIHTPVSGAQPLFLGSFGLGGVVSKPCSGLTQLKTSVPADLSLCGVHFCAQFLIQCASASGTGLTNAVEFRVGG